jgi:hypothetical protein
MNNGTVIGSARTYAQLQPGEAFTYRNWIEACRAGRTFITSGPLLTFTVNGHGPGSIVNLPGPGAKVQVRAEAQSLDPLHFVMVNATGLWSGDPSLPFTTVAKANLGDSARVGVIEAEVNVPASGWLVAACGSANRLPNVQGAAHSSPIYVQVADQPMPVSQSRSESQLDLIDRLLQWVQEEGRFENDTQRATLRQVFESAKDELLKRSESKAGSAGTSS